MLSSKQPVLLRHPEQGSGLQAEVLAIAFLLRASCSSVSGAEGSAFGGNGNKNQLAARPAHQKAGQPSALGQKGKPQASFYFDGGSPTPPLPG